MTNYYKGLRKHNNKIQAYLQDKTRIHNNILNTLSGYTVGTMIYWNNEIQFKFYTIDLGLSNNYKELIEGKLF